MTAAGDHDSHAAEGVQDQHAAAAQDIAPNQHHYTSACSNCAACAFGAAPPPPALAPVHAGAGAGMTMAFRAADPAMLEQVEPGDRVRFVADKVAGAYAVVRLEAAD